MINKENVVVATKYFSIDECMRLYNLGYRNFGENRVDLLLKKKAKLPNDIVWHMIGHLQRNKSKQIANEINYLHTLDSLKLAQMLQKELVEPLNCFIQINLAQIDHKNGILLESLPQFVDEIKKYDKIKIVGFMAIGVIDDDIKTDEIFNKLYNISKEYQLYDLSIGMTNDYQIALKYNPKFIRLGSYFKKIL